MAALQGDPSQNVNERMLHHVHLINTYRYPAMAHINTSEVTKWLLNAPKIARDSAPFYWTYLDVPADGTIMLTWQPQQRMDTNFASDGYVWATGEIFFTQDIGNGFVLEMFLMKAGYRPGEQYAAHARRRFRLAPKQGAVPGTVQADPSLFIVHYGPSEPNDRVPVNMIPQDPRTQATMQSRMQLQRGGQIVRKEFMLADRGNWPHIPLPREVRGQAMYGQPPNARNIPPQMAYPPGPPQAHPSKRARTGAQPSQQHPMGVAAGIEAFDDEEDTSRGDFFDHMTPRDVSMARYRRNHEWMEEVLGSAYRIGQIAPADLGLGLQGELSSLTEGIFEPSGVDAHEKPPKKPVVGHLDAGLADEFRKRVTDKIASETAEMERMKTEHEKAMAKFKSNSLIKSAEQELRFAVEDTGPEFWRLEGRQEDDEDGDNPLGSKQHRKVQDIVASVESALGRHVEVVNDVKRVQAGGYQQPAPEPEPLPVVSSVPAPGDASAAGPSTLSRQASRTGSQNSGIMVGDADIDMGGTAAGLLDQIHGGFSSNSTPLNNFPTPQPQLSAMPSTAATPANAQAQGQGSEDVTMGDTDEARDTYTAPDQGTGSGDWVVVPKDGVSPGAPADASAVGPSNIPGTTSQAPDNAATLATSKPASTTGTPAFGGDNTGFSPLGGDLNSAGDALASYPAAGDTPGEDTMLTPTPMEDNFADAMHGLGDSDAANTPAGGGD